MLLFMVILTAIGLALSMVVHLSAVAGIDPGAYVPGFMMLHVLIFPPFIAALLYSKRAAAEVENDQKITWRAAPRWLTYLTIVLSVYTFFNFFVFLSFNEGTASIGEGNYYLQDHGDFIREITEDEYHRAQAWVARGFSGHWMAFLSGSLTLLIGSHRLIQRAVTPEQLSDSQKELDKAAKRQAKRQAVKLAEMNKRVTGRAALGCLILFMASYVALVRGQPLLSLMVALALTPFGVLHLRRMNRRDDGPIESTVGCLALIPIVIAFITMIEVLGTAFYIAIAVGIVEAANGSVTVLRDDGVVRLSNGDPLIHYWVYGMSHMIVGFAAFIFCFTGLLYLAETVGLWFKQKKPDPEGTELPGEAE